MLDRPRHDLTVEEARDRLEGVVDAALSGVPQTIWRDGKVVVVLSLDKYERLLADSRAHDRAFVEHLLSFPALPEGAEDFLEDRPRIVMRDVEF